MTTSDSDRENQPDEVVVEEGADFQVLADERSPELLSDEDPDAAPLGAPLERETVLEDAELFDVVDDEEEAPEPSPYDRPGQWYVVHTYAGYENKVKQNLASRVRSMNVEERIFEVVIPMEDVIEFKGGRKVVGQKKIFPGYLLVRMDL
ncbi:MAG: transcription termination/antitermination protein NusG, partial [Actinobacteria bacterium]|nr:transcription termination/antitermination protein NusG [Actinomycetota bacterium]